MIEELQNEQKDRCVYYAILKKDYNIDNEEENLQNAVYIGEGDKKRVQRHKNDIYKIRNMKFLYADT